MPVLDIAAQQQPIDIAGSFMRGKASVTGVRGTIP